MADAPSGPTGAGAHAAGKGHGLSKKVGPLPIWGWAAVVIGAYLMFRYLQARSANNAAATAANGTGGGLAPNNAAGIPTPGSTTSGTTPDTTTVSGWLAAAQAALQNLGLDNNTINQALQNYAAGIPLQQSEYNIVESAIKIVGAAPSSLGNPALASQGGGTTGNNPSPTPSLPPINAANYAQKLLYGQWSAADYTQIGVVNKGVYTGTNVSGGVPVYANVFGGLVQGFNMATLPDNTAIYIPTSLLAYDPQAQHPNVKQAA